ncbi:MAG: zinc-finger domain-containing protein [Proteobacteria bacterium]|nr:zinc-finger domain-containing protein [Pseudomonadota bacterium]
MAGSVVPHFANDEGVDRVKVGVHELQCMGARPPYDHPHVYLDMGQDHEILCPYCSTLYVLDDKLGPTQSEPAGCFVAANVPMPVHED